MLVGLLEAALAGPILSFVASSELVQAHALNPMRIMGVITPVIAVGMILTQALFGAGDTKFVMVVELILHFLCLVPLAYVFGVVLDMGMIGLWLAALIYIVLLAGAMVWRFRSGVWQRIKL